MKEATGELNMTVITLVAIAAIGAVFYFLIWPLVQRTLATNSCRTAYGPGYAAHPTQVIDSTSQAQVSDWCCVFDSSTANENNEYAGAQHPSYLLSNGSTDCE